MKITINKEKMFLCATPIFVFIFLFFTLGIYFKHNPSPPRPCDENYILHMKNGSDLTCEMVTSYVRAGMGGLIAITASQRDNGVNTTGGTLYCLRCDGKIHPIPSSQVEWYGEVDD